MENRISIGKAKSLAEFSELVQLFARVFEMENFENSSQFHLKEVFENNSFLPIVANLSGKIVGGATLYILPQYYSRKPLAYIYDLAVDLEYQGNGIGKALMTYSAAYAKQLGCEEMYLQAEGDDHKAIDFYRATKMFTEVQVIQFTHNIEL